MQLLSRLERFAARFFGLIILPAQLPGDPLRAVLDLKDDPIGTLKRWKWSLISQLLRQICTCQKITIPDDPLLESLHQSRTKYLVKGWSQIALHTADGLKLDGYIKAPADSQIPPRYIIFVGGNSQKVSATRGPQRGELADQLTLLFLLSSRAAALSPPCCFSSGVCACAPSARSCGSTRTG